MARFGGSRVALRTAGENRDRSSGTGKGLIVADESIVAQPGGQAADAAFHALHAEREDLERQLAMTQHRQRFGRDAAEIEQAGIDERALLMSLDRVMTQIRAAEYRRRPGARRW